MSDYRDIELMKLKEQRQLNQDTPAVFRVMYHVDGAWKTSGRLYHSSLEAEVTAGGLRNATTEDIDQVCVVKSSGWVKVYEPSKPQRMDEKGWVQDD